ncbi:hypothetical protein [Rhodocyclus gracilis]|uniref:Uncharacterized protein n=1 Tax=Rhodocyclus tenuis TaxID=1066 RepID=A0A6L5JW31_RHOTE|nr:hypothetical protein [Rhodocyclus gracilis]MQY50824.1 hypothetical protein [Rhodocyclus gracilis]
MEKKEPQTAIRADRDEWAELLGVSPTPATLAKVGINETTWTAIRRGRAPLVPVSAYRAARFHRYGDLSELAGGEWRGFAVCDGALTVPGVKRPIPAGELRAWWATLAELHALRFQVVQLQRDVERADAALEAAEQRAAYYRRQLVTESRLALMLAGA